MKEAWIWVGLAIGIGAGVAAAVLLAADTPAPTVLALNAVPVYSCPGSGELGTLHRGDRVLIIGQSEGWLAVRNVRGGGEVVFVEETAVSADVDFSWVPEMNCDASGAVGIETTTSTTNSTLVTTTTLAVTTTVTISPDTTAPSFIQQAASPDHIWEQNSESVSCPPANPREATITAVVSDDVGVTQVSASWQMPGAPATSVTMAHTGSLYSATFGPFPYGTVPETVPYDNPITITLRARDAAGNQSTRSVVVIVTSAASCFA